MHIVPLDPADPQQMAAWHATYHAAQVFGRDVSAPWMLEELRARLLTGEHGECTVAFSGFAFGLAEVMRVLDLAADEPLLRKLAHEAADHHQDYRVRQFVGPVPDDIIDSFGELVGALMTDAPVGELDLEAELVDAERIRANERVLQASGRTRYTTVALATDGAVAAYTELVLPQHDPGRVYQGEPWRTATIADTGSRWPPRPATCSGCSGTAGTSGSWSPTTPR